MIVSHSRRFIFLKTKKTAGSSLELALAQFCSEGDIITPASPDEEPLRVGRGAQNYRLPLASRSLVGMVRASFSRNPERHIGFYNHMPAAQARARLGDAVWSRYFKFAFERNPWDRQVSLYYWRYPDPATRPSFEKFLTDPRWLRTTRNFDIYTIGGVPALDFIGRYDRLEEDLRRALDTIGIEATPELPHLKAATRPPGRDYRGYYTPATQAIIADIYADEIDLLGFEF